MRKVESMEKIEHRAIVKSLTKQEKTPQAILQVDNCLQTSRVAATKHLKVVVPFYREILTNLGVPFRFINPKNASSSCNNNLECRTGSYELSNVNIFVFFQKMLITEHNLDMY